MPRPGPRPYECVRRAWHSDRHQPIRGSLIQEIFRVVSEVHSSATKKNKEWQDKLPVVVLRAEKIMYSKANSEAEYMDLKTLWDRTNDAINTIIRRDESTETGDLLQPCIEAALILGCTPRRASRSQRNCNPSCYLNPGTQDANTFSPGIVNNTIQAYHTANGQCISNYSNFIKPSTANPIVCQNASLASNKFLFAADDGHLSNYKKYLPVKNSSISVFPLYYGSCLEPQQGLGLLPKVVPSISEHVEVGIKQNLFSCNDNTSTQINQKGLKINPTNQHEIGCDLSLRLGSLSAPFSNVQNRQLQNVEVVGARHSHEGCKFNNQIEKTDEVSFFSRVNKGYSRDLCPSKLSENVGVDAVMKKRKIFGRPEDDHTYC